MMTAENGRETWDVNFCIDPFGVHLSYRRCKDDRTGCLRQCVAIHVKRAWIGIKILMRTELHGIDEDADDHLVCEVSSALNEVKMPLVQISHSRYKRNALLG